MVEKLRASNLIVLVESEINNLFLSHFVKKTVTNCLRIEKNARKKLFCYSLSIKQYITNYICKSNYSICISMLYYDSTK